MEASKYDELNSSKIFTIDIKKFESLFIQDLLTYKGFEESIIENRYLKKNKDETELEFVRRTKVVAREFSLSKPEIKNSVDLLKTKSKFTLSITTRQPDLVLQVTSDALIRTNNNVNRKMVSSIDKSVTSYSRENERKLEDIELALETLLKEQKLKTQVRLAFLNEQKVLAKVLDISKYTLSAQTFT